MTNFPVKLWQYYFDEEYQQLVHLSNEQMKNETYSKIELSILETIHGYGLACDLWEKSYNFPEIIEILDRAILSLDLLKENCDPHDFQIVIGLKAMCQINQKAVLVENSMIFNNPTNMVKFSNEAEKIAREALSELSIGTSKIIDQFNELIESYQKYVTAYGRYGEVFVQYQQGNNVEQIYKQNRQYLVETIVQMIENEDRITSSEIKGLLANLDTIYPLWISDQPRINIKKSTHYLSTSFYTGNGFAEHILDDLSYFPVEKISQILFDGKISIESGGIDGLDDFLQTSVGEAYADILHLILPGGKINLLNNEVDFTIHFQIRRFGTATSVIELELMELSVSEFRMIQTLIGPQAGITDIIFQGMKFKRLNEINQFLYDFIRSYQDLWLSQNSGVINFLTMSSANYDADRTWVCRSVLSEVILQYHDNEVDVSDYSQLKESYEFKALTSSLLEGRPSLDDWVQIPDKGYHNLATIRLHLEDLILFDTHSMIIFLPSKPDFILQGVLSTGLLINDISTLIYSFDVMAENVRSKLISQVNQAKLMLEQVEIDKIKSDLKLLRRNVIEVTEFELRALQSIQLLKSQSTIKYPDHGKFVMELIDQSSILSTIDSLEQKITIIKESQEGILRTADDLVSKYQEEVSESQQRLVRVITLIGAGVAQITIIDDILAVFQSQNLISSESAEVVKLFVILLAFLLSGIAISWLGLGYLKSKKNLFE